MWSHAVLDAMRPSAYHPPFRKAQNGPAREVLMATAGQLKSKVDVLKKKIETKGASLTPERKRQVHKRLKRLQRARRTAAALEARAAKKSAKPAAEGAADAAQ